MASRHALDDAAAAALWRLLNEKFEHVGLLYEQGGQIAATPTQTQNDKEATGGTFKVPAGSLRGIFHNHPDMRRAGRKGVESRVDRTRSQFSDTDIKQAKALGVPSYISAGHKLKRYDPNTGRAEDVLAEIPIGVILQHVLERAMNGSSPELAAAARERLNKKGK